MSDFTNGHPGHGAPSNGFGQHQGYGQGPAMPPQGYRPAPRGPGTSPGAFGPASPAPGTPALTYGRPRTAQQPVPTPSPKPKRGGAGKLVAAVLVVGALAGGGAH
jgi:hypothetical protein